MNTNLNEKKQIGINMVANIVSYSTNILVSFILTPFLINKLGKEVYGFYPIANTIVMYMSVLTNAMNTIASRFVTIKLVQKDLQDANYYFTSVLVSNIVLSAILFIPMSIIVIFIDRIMDIPINALASIRALFTLVFISAILNISSSVLGIATFAKNRIDLRSWRELVTAILRILSFYILYKFLSPSIVYVGIVALLVAIVNIIFQLCYTRKLLPELKMKLEFISKKHIKTMFSAGIWNMVNSIGNMLLTGTALIISNILYGAYASGTYSIIQTVPSFINGAISMLVGVFFPVITYRYAENDKKGLISEVHNAQKLIGTFSCATIVVFSVFAQDFFKLWTPGEDAVYLSLLSFITILPHMFISCFWILTNLNVVMNTIKKPAVFLCSLGILNIVINVVIYVLLKPNMIIVPIISSILQVVYTLIYIPQYVCCQLEAKKTTFYGVIPKIFVCSLFTMLISYIIKSSVIINDWFDFIIIGGICGIIGLVIFSIGTLGWTTFLKYLKKIHR